MTRMLTSITLLVLFGNSYEYLDTFNFVRRASGYVYENPYKEIQKISGKFSPSAVKCAEICVLQPYCVAFNVDDTCGTIVLQNISNLTKIERAFSSYYEMDCDEFCRKYDTPEMKLLLVNLGVTSVALPQCSCERATVSLKIPVKRLLH
ncbi:hypothetical protein CHUAL_012670 [Chamberlinius hualienensis]